MSTYDYAVLALAASSVDDLESAKLSAANRLRHMTRDTKDTDGLVRGLGLSPLMPLVRSQQAVVDGLTALEHEAILALQRAVRKHPLGPWVKATTGVGEKQGGRLLAAIGDPYWNTLHDRPRTVSELWAYSGLHVLPASSRSTSDLHMAVAAGGAQTPHPGHVTAEIHAARAGVGSQAGGSHPSSGDHSSSAAAAVPAGGDLDQITSATQRRHVGAAPRRQRGQKVNWSTEAKTRTYLIAESCIKQAASPYRAVYDDGRLKYAASLHQTPCVRCGPKGKPAQPGSPLSAGHQHARAMRLVMKEVLRDLWSESRRLHQQGEEGIAA